MPVSQRQYGVDAAIAKAFSHYIKKECRQELAVVSEALMVYALTLDRMEIAALIDAAREWKATHGDAGEQRRALAETAGESLDRAKRAAEGRPPARKGRKAGNPGA